ncbi:MAG: NADH:ubiquinone reductase (Na(+)-transporting) subunit B [Planctomycetaceae bacterium]|nr:NADH:ubiquinone reductase (Na(+)-transporting) subunit B [Planctomycetaceae bacterium]
MRPIRFLLDRTEPLFRQGKPLGRLYPVYEVIDTFFYTPGEVAEGSCHVRDSIDFKRAMSVVLVALVPCVVMAMYNTGYQAHRAMTEMGITQVPGWRGAVLGAVAPWGVSGSLLGNLVHGALYFLPIYAVTMAVGLGWEILFAVLRKHEVNEGFFVTGLIFPLTLPASIPLWQVAVGISFGVVIAKEIFGGTGRNFLNPALAARAFLFFAYPAQISGDSVWVAVDGFSGATPLALAASGGLEAVAASTTWFSAMIGTIPGSMGETSAIACLIGAAVMLTAGIGSWRIMASMLGGAMAVATLMYVVGSPTNPAFSIPPHWHLALGGLAFGLVFMATDPVTAAMTGTGQVLYGLLIGAIVILVRVINPAFPEGTMLAILLGNVCAPLLDYYVVRANIRRRVLRHA